MGDRALIQVVSGEQVSPVCYLHWHGDAAPKFICELAERMKGRDGDIAYAFARLIGICHSHIDGNTSLGCWSAEEKLTEGDSHGDAGVFIVDCNTWSVEALGGYGRSFNARTASNEAA